MSWFEDLFIKEAENALHKHSCSGGNVNQGGGYDLVIDCSSSPHTVVHGSYEETKAKFLAGVPPMVALLSTNYKEDGIIKFEFYPVDTLIHRINERTIWISKDYESHYVLHEDNHVEYTSD